MPPKPAEAAKVQPKKETVRINLPPKPTSAPTIKLPTLAQSGPAASAGPPRQPLHGRRRLLRPRRRLHLRALRPRPR